MATALAAPVGHGTAPAAPRPPAAVVGLSWLIAALAVPTTVVELTWRGGDGPTTVITARGEAVELYGRGLHELDTLFGAGGALGSAAVTLLLGVPLLILATEGYRRGSLRAGLLQSGVLLYFLYVYASAALGAIAYNELFLAYVALFSASLFGFVVALTSLVRVAPRFYSGASRRGPATFLFVSAAVTFLVWTLPLVAAALAGEAPDRLDTYTTELTYALDVGVIVPAVAVAGVLILRGETAGYLLAVPLLVLEAALAPLIAAQTIGQVVAGVEFTPAEVVGPIVGFVTIAVLAVWFLVRILRHVTLR